jgi:hypothetical protein
VIRQRFPGEAQGPHIEGWREAAIGLRDHGLEPTAFAEATHEAAAGGIHVMMLDEGMDLLCSPFPQAFGKLPVTGLEERPGEKARVDHVNLP